MFKKPPPFKKCPVCGYEGNWHYSVFKMEDDAYYHHYRCPRCNRIWSIREAK